MSPWALRECNFLPVAPEGSTFERYRRGIPVARPVHEAGFYVTGSALLLPPKVGTDRSGDLERGCGTGLIPGKRVVDNMAALMLQSELAGTTIGIAGIVGYEINGVVVFDSENVFCLTQLTVMGKLNGGARLSD